MNDIPIDDMTKERLLVEYKHYVNATELKKTLFINWLKTLPTTCDSICDFDDGYAECADDVLVKARELL